MNRSHLIILVLLTAGVAIAGAMLQVGEVDADPFCTRTTCVGATLQTVGPITATSTQDCHWARMAAVSQLSAQTYCPFGFCDENFITIDDCADNDPSPWSVTMKLDYSCARCIGPFQQ